MLHNYENYLRETSNIKHIWQKVNQNYIKTWKKATKTKKYMAGIFMNVILILNVTLIISTKYNTSVPDFFAQSSNCSGKKLDFY